MKDALEPEEDLIGEKNTVGKRGPRHNKTDLNTVLGQQTRTGSKSSIYGASFQGPNEKTVNVLLHDEYSPMI